MFVGLDSIKTKGGNRVKIVYQVGVYTSWVITVEPVLPALTRNTRGLLARISLSI